MRLLVLAITFSVLMNHVTFAASEEAAECDMDIELELLAIQNKEKRQQTKKEPAFLAEEQKSIMIDTEHQEPIGEDKKK